MVFILLLSGVLVLLVLVIGGVSGIGTVVVMGGNDGVSGGIFWCCVCDCCRVC